MAKRPTIKELEKRLNDCTQGFDSLVKEYSIMGQKRRMEYLARFECENSKNRWVPVSFLLGTIVGLGFGMVFWL